MRKTRKHMLDDFTEELTEWFGEGKATAVEVKARLRKRGVSVSLPTLYTWWREYSNHQLEEQLLEQIASGAKQCAEIEKAFAQHPAPPIETLIQLHRVFVLKLSNQAQQSPALFRLVTNLMKPLLDWTKLEDQRQQREREEQRRRDAEELGTAGGNALTPETLQKIERELGLF